ncbi:MAG: hypothetical protein AB8U44_02450 [Aaplasma endosymbiont of Hyalomma asiaticum]
MSKNLLANPESSSIFNSATWSSSVYGNRGCEQEKLGSKILGLGQKLKNVLLKAAICLLSCAMFVISYLALLLTQILVVPITAMVACLALVGYASFFMLCNILRNVHFAVGNLSGKLKKTFKKIRDNIFESISPSRQNNDTPQWGFGRSRHDVSLWDLCVEEVSNLLSVRRHFKNMFSVDFLAKVVAHMIAGTVIAAVAVPLLAVIIASAVLVPIVLVVILSPCMVLGHFTVGDETLQRWSSEICGEWGHNAFNVNPSSPYADSPDCNDYPTYTEADKMFPGNNSPESAVSLSSISCALQPKRLVIS